MSSRNWLEIWNGRPASETSTLPILEQAGDVGGIGGGGDGDDGPGIRNLHRGGQDGGAAETVADQDRWRLARCAQMVGGAHQIGDVRGKRRVGKVAFAGAEARKIEPQHGDAFCRQRHRDALRRQHILAARKTMREQRIGLRLPLGQVERCREFLALGARELETFSRHGWPPWLLPRTQSPE